MKHEVCAETEEEKEKMAPPVMSEPTVTTAPPPTDSFMQKTISICSPINVRLPSALVSAASRCDSTRRTAPTHLTTCQRGRAGREPSLGPTLKLRAQRGQQTTNHNKSSCRGASEQGITSKLLQEKHSEDTLHQLLKVTKTTKKRLFSSTYFFQRVNFSLSGERSGVLQLNFLHSYSM